MTTNTFFSKSSGRLSALFTAGLVCSNTYAEPLKEPLTKPLPEIKVTAELLEQNALELPNSVTVIDEALIAARQANNLEDLLNFAPNVNFSTGASRGRFIQIRGIGERSEFQEPLINSVGVIVDGIDLTGIATAATTLDIDQVEVLRGPQGTLFGANALAGVINVVSNKPGNEPYAKVGVGIEEYNGHDLSAVLSSPLSANSGLRLAVKNYQSDGFTKNVFLQRDDTNNIDETTAKLGFYQALNDNANLQVHLLKVDVDNGYDAFSLDNTRQTYSDQPGHDRQDTEAASFNLDWQLSESLSFDALLSHAKSELEYGYDEDWSHTGICDGTPCDSALAGFDWWYSSFDNYARDNDNTTLDLRLSANNDSGASWVAGVYHRDQSVDLLRTYTFLDNDFTSQHDTSNTAIYGQLDTPLNERLTLITGLRVEQREVEYRDNNAVRIDNDENLWGGRIALEYHHNENTLIYGLLSRGYKNGGFNTSGDIAEALIEFDSETMLNYELGLKKSALDGALQLQAALFYQDRKDVQTKQSIVSSIATGEVGGTCPCRFTDFTDNATSGSNFGLELELNWQVNAALNTYATLGLLDSEFDDYLSFEHVDADRDNGVAFNLNGREQSHAPSYQIVLGGSYAFAPGWKIGGYIEAKDAFFFSDRHSEKSDAYETLNLELAYQADNWTVALYGKNLTDETIKTRGFGSFGNDPRNFYEVEPYNQFAAPRIVGIKASYEFK